MGKPKRPRDRGRGTSDRDALELAKPATIPSAAFVRAYEAELGGGTSYPPISWAGDGDDDSKVTADRHNIVHLLTTLPSPRAASVGSASSSWSSADEEAFDLSGDEVAAHARTRRERWVAELRETRLREREKEDAEAVARSAAADIDGDEPAPDVVSLMDHTARALAASPNPALLEMRIVARHASDPRFNFLRGEWAGAWRRVKEERGVKPPAQSTSSKASTTTAAKATPAPGLGLSYGTDSDSDGNSNSHSDASQATPRPPSESPPPTPPPPSEPAP